MSFLLVVNRLDALISRIERLTAAITGVPVPELPQVGVPVAELPEIVIPPPEVVISQPMLPNRYKIFRAELDRVYTDEPLGVGELLKGVETPYASYMSIITVPFEFTFKLNSTDMDAIEASVGLEQEDFEITEIFITNTVAQAAGTVALVEVEYRVD